MPHLVVEYASGTGRQPDIPRLCEALYQAMLAAGIFPRAGIRIRAYPAQFAIIADQHPHNGFVALTLSVGAGRSAQELREAGDLIFQAAQKELAELLAEPHFALSLQIRVIDPELSWKDTPIHARLTGPRTQGPANEQS